MSLAQIQPEDSDRCIQKQLWRLRHEDPTQYHTLVKMHLSFATDLPTDECDGRLSETTTSRRWQLTPLIKKLSRAAVSSKGVMEGAPLTQEGVCQVFQVLHYLNKENNIIQEGLFRKNGSLSRQQELKNLLNSGADLNLDCGMYSPHDCASVLKSFLADLPEPLLTEAHYPIHCRIAEMLQSHMSHTQKAAVHTRQIKALRLLFLLLPPENYQLLHDLLILLHRVASHQKQNLMSAINLGTMFAPHILCPRKMTPNDLQYLSGPLSIAVAFMIEQVPHLFQIPLELEYDVRQYWNNKKKLHHQLSKRSLMDAPANTIFTFIDRELTAQANDKDVTEVALAELYAYVQALPDSAKKRKLIKQFNTASGLGTPQLNQSVNKKQEARGRRLGESIKRVIMTPRSRCPIIINSSSSLSNVAIPEENSQTPILQSIRHHLPTPEDIHTSPVITNPTALLTSPKTLPTQTDSSIQNSSSQDCFAKLSDADFEDDNSNKVKEGLHTGGGETKASRWSSSSLRCTLSSASSTTSLFGSFFRHLSTTSLAQLATKLTSTTSLHKPEEEEKEESEGECEENDDLNESLSSVFKGYLLSRSILTDSPVDLSVVYADEGNEDNGFKEKSPYGSKSDSENGDDDSAYDSSQPPSKTTSRQCSKASLSSLDSAHDLYSSSELSESLLHCLDGHDPSQAKDRNGDSRTQSSDTKPKRHSVCTDSEQPLRLYSCSPDGRSQSLLKTKQGTPVPQRETSNTEAAPSAHGVIFETSL
ncbi:rho GTPase-activating protein 19-like isoform X3 [Portunus trituberculatus]|uniref:rho GTPase-activating protein 19-like isoform X3 n=1 Tax=Portunus trituberculatus TaxID=210409 RepID=UPI001E1CE23D|nr:rho GTPase-activating protein 19-like isoform X3 [Portunus trituberculatus]